MYWSFAIVNGRLAEVFFDRSKNGTVKIEGHCYVKMEEYTTKKEQHWIEKDCEKACFVYRNKKYSRAAT